MFKMFCSGLCIIDFYAAVLHYQDLKRSALYQRSKRYTCTPAHIMASGVMYLIYSAYQCFWSAHAKCYKPS